MIPRKPLLLACVSAAVVLVPCFLALPLHWQLLVLRWLVAGLVLAAGWVVISAVVLVEYRDDKREVTWLRPGRTLDEIRRQAEHQEGLR